MAEVHPPRLLVTAFSPDPPGAALLTARAIDPNATALRSSFNEVDRFLDRLEHESFDAWLMLADSTRAKKIVVEITARNLTNDQRDAEDAARPGVIEPDGPETLQAPLWTKTVVWVPSLGWHVSRDAGGHVANYALYRALRRFPNRAIGLAHVPAGSDANVDRGHRILSTLLERCVTPLKRESAPTAPRPL